MKTTIYLTEKELKGSGFRRGNIKIRLDDKCKNGHEDFSITADFWDIRNNTKEADMGGCCHEEILKLRPDLKCFVDLHLNTSKGVPMYAIENGMYFIFNEKKYDIAKDHFKINDIELDVLKGLPDDDKEYFQYTLEKMLLPERWQTMADHAIKRLEEMTGEKYIDHSTKNTFAPLSEEVKRGIEEKISSGYYSKDAIAKRKRDKKEKAKKDAIQTLINDHNKKVKKDKLDLDITIWLLKNDVPRFSNYIFYNHTRTLTFNWNTGYGNKKWTKEEFDHLVKKMERAPLFLNEGIKFELRP